MQAFRWLLVASLAACGGSKSPPTPEPSPPAKPLSVEPPAKVGEPAAAPPAPVAKPPFQRESLPLIKPVATKRGSAVFRAPDSESRFEIYAVDADAEALLFATTPRVNWAFKATGKRFTGALHAADHTWDAFTTIAELIGADVTPINSDPENQKPTLDIEFRAAPLRDVLRLIGDTGRVNVVVAPGELPALTLRIKRLPWDLLLDATVARAGLTAFREGTAIYVVPAGTNVEVNKAKPTGPLLDLELHDATLAEAVTAIRTVTPLELGSCSTTAKLTFRVRKMPRAQVITALEIASGERLTDKNPCPTAKALANEPPGELTLTAIASVGETRGAAFAHKGGILHGTRKQPRLEDIGPAFVSFDTGENLKLYDFGSIESGPHEVPDVVRTAALIKRGERWHALLEMTDGFARRVSSRDHVSDTVTAEVTADGVSLRGDGSSARSFPLAPK